MSEMGSVVGNSQRGEYLGKLEEHTKYSQSLPHTSMFNYSLFFPGYIYSKCLLLMKINLNFHPCNTDPIICPTGRAESQRNFSEYWYLGPL